MLIDSGADFSVIAHKTGLDLGFRLADAEQTLPAYGIGGTVDYVLRKIKLTINGIHFMAPIAWLQDEGIDEMIIGCTPKFFALNIYFL